MATDLAPGHVRVFARAGVGRLLAWRWGDVRRDDPRLEEWLRAGLVTATGPRGEDAPERLRQPCCGQGLSR